MEDPKYGGGISAPRWDLRSIFTDSEFEDSVVKYCSGLDELDSLLNAASAFNSEKVHSEFDFPLWLSTFYPVMNRVCALEETLNAFAYAAYSVDTANTVCLNRIAKLDEIGLRSRNQMMRFCRALADNVSVFDDFFVRFPQYKSYRYIMMLDADDIKHRMSYAEEDIASDLERTGAGAWGRLHEQLIASLCDEKGRTFNEVRGLAYDMSAEVRKEAWETEIKLLSSVALPAAACLNNLKGATISLNKRRGWKDPLERALSSARMGRGTLDALIGAIEGSLPMWRKYLKIKARILSSGESCAFYDLFAPLPADNTRDFQERKWTYDEARSYITECFASFSQEMGAFARRAFENGWIDAEIRPGKVGGAYCTDLPSIKESRILSNFSGSFSDVVTLAHELGHAFHHHCISSMDYGLTHYPMTLAETASIFAETIVMKDSVSKTDGYEKMRMVETHLQDSCQVLVDILCRFYFERQVFEERGRGELSAEDFCRIMADAQEKTYGDGLSHERHEYMWAVKSHYYSPDLDFYNFPYAFGLLFGTGLYGLYEKEGASFADTYVKLLKETGSLSCEAVCRNAGFDITSKEFWKSGIDQFQKEIELFEQWSGVRP